MSIGFEIVVYYVQIIMLHAIAAPFFMRNAHREVLARNPEWVAAHPEIWHQYPPPARNIVFSRCLTPVLALTYPLLGLWWPLDWSLMLALHLSVIAFMVHFGLVYWLGLRGLRKAVPSPERRVASLERRDLSDFVHLAWYWGAVVFNLCVSGAFAVAHVVGVIELPAAIENICVLVFGFLVGSGVLMYTLRRTTQRHDALFNGMYRQIEVRGIVGLLYFMSIVGVFNFAEVAFDYSPIDDLGLPVMLSIFCQLVTAVYMWGMNGLRRPEADASVPTADSGAVSG